MTGVSPYSPVVKVEMVPFSSTAKFSSVFTSVPSALYSAYTAPGSKVLPSSENFRSFVDPGNTIDTAGYFGADAFSEKFWNHHNNLSSI